MTGRPPPETARLADLTAAEDAIGAGALVRAAASAAMAPELTDISRRRIRRELVRTLDGRDRRHHRRARRLRLALVVALAGIGGGVVSAQLAPMISSLIAPRRDPDGDRGTEDSPRARRVHGGRRAGRDITAVPAPAEPPTEAAPPAIVSPPPAIVSSPPSPAEAAPVPPEPARASSATPAPPPRAPAARAPAADGVEPRRPQERRVSPPPPVPPPAPGAAALAPAAAAAAPVAPRDEAAVLADAIRRLRVNGDAVAALAALDERAARFSGGALGPEASALRIEALLALGRKSTALEQLERLPLSALPRRTEWHVVRGELRAAAGRWRAAAADFDAALAAPLGPAAAGDVGERALWGRAVARAEVGDDAGARADCRDYLQRFPGGRFARDARRLLDGGAGGP